MFNKYHSIFSLCFLLFFFYVSLCPQMDLEYLYNGAIYLSV